MAWFKFFARDTETSNKTEYEVHEQNLNRVPREQEPERREQRVLETRRWRDPNNKMSCSNPDGR
jgi:hypothetical protein